MFESQYLDLYHVPWNAISHRGFFYGMIQISPTMNSKLKILVIKGTKLNKKPKPLIYQDVYDSPVRLSST